MVFINLELGINNEGERKLASLQSVFETIDVSMVKFEGESYINIVDSKVSANCCVFIYPSADFCAVQTM